MVKTEINWYDLDDLYCYFKLGGKEETRELIDEAAKKATVLLQKEIEKGLESGKLFEYGGREIRSINDFYSATKTLEGLYYFLAVTRWDKISNRRAGIKEKDVMKLDLDPEVGKTIARFILAGKDENKGAAKDLKELGATDEDIKSISKAIAPMRDPRKEALASYLRTGLPENVETLWGFIKSYSGKSGYLFYPLVFLLGKEYVRVCKSRFPKSWKKLMFREKKETLYSFYGRQLIALFNNYRNYHHGIPGHALKLFCKLVGKNVRLVKPTYWSVRGFHFENVSFPIKFNLELSKLLGNIIARGRIPLPSYKKNVGVTTYNLQINCRIAHITSIKSTINHIFGESSLKESEQKTRLGTGFWITVPLAQYWLDVLIDEKIEAYIPPIGGKRKSSRDNKVPKSLFMFLKTHPNHAKAFIYGYVKLRGGLSGKPLHIRGSNEIVLNQIIELLQSISKKYELTPSTKVSVKEKKHFRVTLTTDATQKYQKEIVEYVEKLVAKKSK